MTRNSPQPAKQFQAASRESQASEPVRPNKVSTPSNALGVLLIGGDFQAVGILHALNAAKIPVFLVATEPSIACYSNCAMRRQRKYNLVDADDGVDFLCALADEQHLQDWVIFCVDDETVEFLAKNHNRLAEKFVLSVSPWEITQRFYEKDQASRLADECNIPIPKHYPAPNLEQLLAQDIDYPVVIKPTFKKNYYEKTNDKAVLASNEQELIREYKAMNRLIPSSQIVLQEFLPGGTRNLYSFAALFDGQKIVSGLSAKRLRQHPMDFGHATTYAESRDMPELEELATRFLRKLNYKGVAEVEFMFDERTGQYKFIEMNGRFWGWHSLTYHAGLNFPRDLFRMLVGYPIERQHPEIGIKWTRLLTDTPIVLVETLRGRMPISTAVRSFFESRTDAVWSWRDPMPFITEVLMAPYLWWKKGF